MLPLFEGFLEPSQRSGADEGAYDLVREGVVVLLGTLAGHMEQKDDKVRGAGVGWGGGGGGGVQGASRSWLGREGLLEGFRRRLFGLHLPWVGVERRGRPHAKEIKSCLQARCMDRGLQDAL